RHVRFVTKGAVGPDGAEPRRWDEGAALWGLLSVVQAEYPRLDCRGLDLDPDGPTPETAELTALLMGMGEESRLALRRGETFAARLMRAEFHDDGERRPVPAGANYRIDIEQRGTLDAMRYVPAERVAPGDDEVEIRVRTTGLNFRDV